MFPDGFAEPVAEAMSCQLLPRGGAATTGNEQERA